jgi:hypothetical protein
MMIIRDFSVMFDEKDKRGTYDEVATELKSLPAHKSFVTATLHQL